MTIILIRQDVRQGSTCRLDSQALFGVRVSPAATPTRGCGAFTILGLMILNETETGVWESSPLGRWSSE